MRRYLSRSVSSFNQNKLRGLLAEIQLRQYLALIGYADRVSSGGWIFRNTRANDFGRNTIAAFPEVIQPNTSYERHRVPRPIPNGLHAIGNVFHQSGIHAYYCSAEIVEHHNAESVLWRSVQLGVPGNPPYNAFPQGIAGFTERDRRYGWLRYHANVGSVPNSAVPEEFSKENLRVAFGTEYFAEVSDVDGVFWGKQHTYPLEIKEKTAAYDRNIGEYFGLDLGPFVKLVFYAAKRSNLRSLFVVREIDDVENRNLRQWWYMTFEDLAQVASWVGLPGGRGMGGGRSAVVRIPKSQFQPLEQATLANL
jgi:hypothetical protein